MAHTLYSVSAWLDTLGPEELHLLQSHRNDLALPQEVVELLHEGPMSPMIVGPDPEKGLAMMPLWVSQALESYR
jgi:hypothetical protein